MKIKYYYYELQSAFGHPSSIQSGVEFLEPKNLIDSRAVYISCLDSLARSINGCEKILTALNNVELEIKELDAVGLNDDSLTVYKDYIQLDIDIDDSLIDQPEGRFTHDQIRKAVEGKIKFLNMEKQVGVELEVDIG